MRQSFHMVLFFVKLALYILEFGFGYIHKKLQLQQNTQESHFLFVMNLLFTNISNSAQLK